MSRTRALSVLMWLLAALVSVAAMFATGSLWFGAVGGVCLTLATAMGGPYGRDAGRDRTGSER